MQAIASNTQTRASQRDCLNGRRQESSRSLIPVCVPANSTRIVPASSLSMPSLVLGLLFTSSMSYDFFEGRAGVVAGVVAVSDGSSELIFRYRAVRYVLILTF